MKGWGVVLLLLGKTSLAAAPSGLLDQPQTFPWSVGLTPVVQEEAGGLETGSYRLRSSVLWFNTYRQFGAGDETTQVVDMEGVLATLSAAWAPAPGWEFRGQVQGWSLGGGVMDPWLSWFHTAGGLPNQGRESAPLDGYRDFLAGSFDDRTPSSGLSQASVALRRWQGPWSWTSWIKLPVPSHVGWGWSSRWGGGLGLGWGDRWRWSEARLTLGAGVSGALVLAEQESAIPGVDSAATGQGGFYTTAEWSGGPRLLVQGTWTRMPDTGVGYLDQGAGLLTMGIQFPLDKHWTYEGAITEEFFTWATMEVGLQTGAAWNL